MQLLIVCVVLVSVALAAPHAEVRTLHSESEVGPESYKYSFETSDGSSHSEEGHLQNVGTENEAIAVRGRFSFVGDDGVTYTVNYLADENGFQPEAAHLPAFTAA